MQKFNQVSTPTGVRKSALLLLSLGADQAAEILKHLDDTMLEAVILEMSKIRAISKEERAQVLSEFHSTISELKDGAQGGLDTAKNLLERSVGTEKASIILKKINKEETKNDFEFLNQVEPGVMQAILAQESLKSSRSPFQI